MASSLIENMYEARTFNGTSQEMIGGFGVSTSVAYINELKESVCALIGDKAHEALKLGMIADRLYAENKDGRGITIPYMGIRDVVMVRDPNGILWISKNFYKYSSCDFSVVNLVNSARSSLREKFSCEYGKESFSLKKSCAYATGRMIKLQKMIDELFRNQPLERDLSVKEISDVKTRDAICILYNSGIDTKADILKVFPGEFELNN